MSIYATSDLHGNLIEPPQDATVLLLAGDICPDFIGGLYSSRVKFDNGHQRQANWLKTEFKAWAENIGVPIIATWGNHDYVGEHPHLVPEISNVTWLVDELHVEGDLRVWGTPWVPNLPRWAFYGSPAALEARAELIPVGLDVLMTHGPPYAIADFIPVQRIHVGERSMSVTIRRISPRVTICGHIHESRGDWKLWGADDPLHVLNVSAVDGYYDLYPVQWRCLDEFLA